MPTVDFPDRVDAPPNPTPTPGEVLARLKRAAEQSRAERYSSPAALFYAHATPAPAPVKPLRKLKSPEDWLSDADAAGFTVLRRTALDGGTYFTTQRGNYVSTVRSRSAAAAAMAAAISAGFGPSLPAVTHWRVPEWLANALIELGEALALSHDTGPDVWGCTSPSFDPDTCPPLVTVFEAYKAGRLHNAP